ncbi:hypothetical protein SAMN05444141_107199 [Pseudovibrio denitrificans]|uniref:Peptidase U49 n=1 Tax=Pseudovibrio denitrificans TaxID=258256 RepID=A0A1I7D281_9HYPH|nr:hypothetical protein [Pseudovibrio denitrificans]SFU05820.1 hypothetical protein SAMN05444141_107199 [Pseudovibrio denitrificans]
MQIISIIAFLITFTASNFAAAQTSERLRAARQIQAITQQDINSIVKPALLNAMLPKERRIAEAVNIVVVVDERIGRVVAFIDNFSQRKIEISTGFLALIGASIDANLIAGKWGYLKEIGEYKNKIANFLRGARREIREGGTPIKPESFAEYVGLPDDQYKKFSKSKEYDYSFSVAMRVMLSFVLAHEYAHHVFNHFENTPASCLNAPLGEDCLKARRAQEDEADDFGVRLNWMLGNNPLFATNYFMIFGLVENGLLSSEHSPSVCRLEKVLDAGIQFSENSDRIVQHLLQQNSEFQKQFKMLKNFRVVLKEQCEAGGLLTDTVVPGLF